MKFPCNALTPTKSVLSILATASLLATPLHAEETILQQTFSDGERSTQMLPSSAAWFTSHESEKVAVKKGSLVSDPNRHLIAYFADPDDLAELKEGESLTLTVEMSVSKPEANYSVLRIGLFNSGGSDSRVTADNEGIINKKFQTYTGYAAFLDFGQATALTLVRREGDVSDRLIHSSEAFPTTLLKSAGQGGDFVDDEPFTLIFKVSREEGGMRVSCEVADRDGFQADAVDTGSPITTFDTIVLQGARLGMKDFAIKSVTLSR